jgi:hypothetical protein
MVERRQKPSEVATLLQRNFVDPQSISRNSESEACRLMFLARLKDDVGCQIRILISSRRKWKGWLTYLTSESRIQASRAPHQLSQPTLPQPAMARHNNIQLPSNKGDIQLAISSLNAHQLRSNRRAAAIFNVSETTLRDQRAGKPA